MGIDGPSWGFSDNCNVLGNTQDTFMDSIIIKTASLFSIIKMKVTKEKRSYGRFPASAVLTPSKKKVWKRSCRV